MKLKLNTLIAFFVVMGAFLNKNYAQQARPFNPYHIFDKDSLQGFEEDAARRSAISEQFVGDEFKVRMYQLKRKYINDKYNLVKPIPKQNNNYFVAKSSVVPACTNEDFEASTAATITSASQINGWTMSAGNHSVASGANSCNLLGCCNFAPYESELISAPNGYIDPVIGSVYPIFSVFGSTAGNSNGPTYNPQITQAMKGDNFIRINSSNNNFSIEKLSKTFAVTANNALFQFAFISVFYPGHGCCDAGAFQINLINATTNATIACPHFTASAISSACTNTASTINYLISQTGVPTTTANYNPIYNPWQITSMDLSQYIGQNITIEIIASDCTGGGHYGYVYFDAQCGPNVVYGNGNPYGAGITNVTVPTCGATGATMCASAGLGPYSWAGPNVPLNYATPSMTNGCFISTVSATYTLSMNPAGSCVPITRVITSTITPAPSIFASAVQALCGQTTAVVSVTTSGSSANPASLAWSPPPLTLSTNTRVGTYVIPAGPASNIVTITVSDNVGCQVSATAAVMPAPPNPTFNLAYAGSPSITCLNPTVTVQAVTNYTYGTLNYFWQSSTATYSTDIVGVTTPGSYTVIATDPNTTCSNVRTITVASFTTPPVASLTNTFQNVTCAALNFSNVVVTASSPTVNVTTQVLSPLGGSFVSTSPTSTYVPGAIGIFTVIITNDINGCSVTKNFTITSNQGFPTFAVVSSPANYTLGCSTKSVLTLQVVNASATNTLQVPTGGPVSYTLLPPGNTASVPPSTLLGASSTFTVNSAGTWTLVTRDNNSYCDTRLPLSILDNKQGPKIDTVIIPDPVLSCKTPTVNIQAISSTPNVNYVWQLPIINQQVPNSTITVAANNTVAPSTTVTGIYTLQITDNNNLCISAKTYTIFQNLFPPTVKIAPSVTSLSCKTPSVTLTNNSSSGIPTGIGFPPGGPVVASVWNGPSPQVSYSNTTTYVGLTVGTYSMIGTDVANGCTGTATVAISDNRIYPTITLPSADTLDCGSSATLLAVAFPSTGVTFSWTAAEGGSISQFTTASTQVYFPGAYKVTVTNTLNGCVSSREVDVVTNTLLTTSFEADNVSGFAPLTVNFNNKSRTANGTASITSVWDFGNSRTLTNNTNASFTSSATYTAPGNYTVSLYTAKGNCMGKSTMVIHVDVPSSYVIPNVFTPNGDGVNDYYFLKLTNIAQVTAVIYDRWGHKVYEIDTQSTTNNKDGKDNVNLSWDGKNQLGVEVPEGNYFYVIKITGKDGKEKQEKGSITLLR